jgi:iron complex outermembrane recepter protein
MRIPSRRVHGASCAAALVLVAVSHPAPAQTSVSAGISQNVTVTAKRLSPTAPGEAAARAEAARVPGGSNIIGLGEYADGRASTLADVFALAPGVFAQSRFGAEEARLSIRGSGLQRTFHMRGIWLLQDGVPLTLADGGGDFQAIEPLALAYTEVLRGANALQYGGATLGGSINFVSPSGRDGGSFSPRAEAGSFGYRRVLLRGGDASERMDWAGSLAGYTQDGYRDWSEQRNVRAFGNVGVKLRDDLETRFYVAAVDTDSQLPGSLTKAQLASNPRQANAGSLAGQQKRDFELYRVANRTAWTFSDRVLEANVGFSYKDLWHPIFQVLQQRSNDWTAGLRYIDERSLAERPNRLVLGAVSFWNTVEDDRFVNVAGQRGARTAESTQRAANLSLYAENQWTVVPTLTLIGGAQWTQSERRFLDRFLSNGDQGFDATYARISPTVGALWQATPTIALYGNVADSFEPPSFGELAGGPGVTLLEAQRARTAELGSRGSAGIARWDVSLYHARVRDELLSLETPTGQPLGTTNAPRTIHQGAELGLGVRATPALDLNVAYLWNDFRFDGDRTFGDNPLPGIPEHFARAELRWSAPREHYVALTGEWSPERYAVDMANTLFADSYAIWGLKLGREPGRGVSWFVEGRNLADRTYAATTGVIANARGRDSAQFLPGDGRSVYVGVEWRP